MPRFAEYFATLRDGKMVSVTSATPAHELLPNQVMLTEKEYKLLRVVQSIAEAEALLNSVKWKIAELEKSNV